ncbi:MAG: VOC family protein, partial [Bacteroidales bacterium]|nr:VOC family protein [Bacteroidales bacterium]
MKDTFSLSGIQQVGIGVRDVAAAWRWYNEFFGVDAIIFDEKAPAEYMLPYTGGKPLNRRAVLALNLNGGGGFEIWQHRNFEPRAAEFKILPGDYGVYACKIKCRDAVKTHKLYMEKGAQVSPVYKDFLNRDYFYV